MIEKGERAMKIHYFQRYHKGEDVATINVFK